MKKYIFYIIMILFLCGAILCSCNINRPDTGSSPEESAEPTEKTTEEETEPAESVIETETGTGIEQTKQESKGENESKTEATLESSETEAYSQWVYDESETSFEQKTPLWTELYGNVPVFGEIDTAVEKKNIVPNQNVTFSHESGTHQESFFLTMYSTGEIYYTLDGSIPTKDSFHYTQPIFIEDATTWPNFLSARTDFTTYFEKDLFDHVNQHHHYAIPQYNVDKCTVIRAVAFDSNGNRSEETTATYFVGFRDKEGYNGTNVISIIMDPDDLLNYETGIHVTGKTFDVFKEDYMIKKESEIERILAERASSLAEEGSITEESGSETEPAESEESTVPEESIAGSESESTSSESGSHEDKESSDISGTETTEEESTEEEIEVDINKQPKWWWFPANYLKSGRETERNAYFSFFDYFGEGILTNKYAALRIQGNGSRGYIQKSYNFYSRKEYDGSGKFKADFFSTGYEAKRIQLFCGGDDLFMKLKDLIVAELLQNKNCVNRIFVPYSMFLNGEYFGLYYLTEKYDEKYFSYYYDVPEEEVVFIKEWNVEVGNTSDYDLFEDMRYYIIHNDMTKPDKYAKACELIDMDSFLDYMSIMIYIERHQDWPLLNFGLWRTRTTGGTGYNDGKWRWVLFDFNGRDMRNYDTTTDSLKVALKGDAMFASLFKNENFRKELIRRVISLGENELSWENMESFIAVYKEVLFPAIKKNWARYNDTHIYGTIEVEVYLSWLEEFFETRLEVVKERYSEYLE